MRRMKCRYPLSKILRTSILYTLYIHKFESNFTQYFCWAFVLTEIHDVCSGMEFSTCGIKLQLKNFFYFETFWIWNTQPVLE